MNQDKTRLDHALVLQRLVASRSQAESWIRLGKVKVDGRAVTKPGYFVRPEVKVTLAADEQYVSRAGLKLASVAKLLGINFADKIVLDVGSSTGGFTDYALKHGAKKVYAVDVGTEQLHPSLRGDERIELYEKTDIRDVGASRPLLSSQISTKSARKSLDAGPVSASAPSSRKSEISLEAGAAPRAATRLSQIPDIVVMDVSFISLREILPHIAKNLSGKDTQIVAMLKPQFEAGKHQVNKGVIKNDAVRRQILKDFEAWAKQYFIIQDKRDSDVAGAKGNQERFYLLTLNRNSTTSPGRMA